MPTQIITTPVSQRPTSFVIHLNGGHTQVTYWDYSLEQRDEVVYINDEAVIYIQLAPALVVLRTQHHVVLVPEDYFRKRAREAGIVLPSTGE